MRTLFFTSLLVMFLAVLLTGCDKEGNGTDSRYTLSYSDSILFIRNQASDYIVYPAQPNPNGEFTGFPEGIELDKVTGAINVSKSETGLRYRITYKDNSTGETSSVIVLISGINYYDNIYSLATNDTLAMPLYNASLSRSIPSNSIFDEGNGCNGVGVAVNTNSAVINLAQTIRNGVFGSTPSNGAQKEVELKYRVNDGSDKSLNSLKVKLYYYDTYADITPDLKQLLTDRQGTIFGANTQSSLGTEILSGSAGNSGVSGVAKPRPPCIFIVGRM